MRYPLPELLDLSPALLGALSAHPGHYQTVGGSGALPQAMQFQLDYAPGATAPASPLPVLIVTLYPALGAYAMNLGLVAAGDAYNNEHDDPVASPLLIRSVVVALLGQCGLLLPAVPGDPELLRPLPEPERAVQGVDELLEAPPAQTVVTQNDNPNELIGAATVLGLGAARPGERVLTARLEPGAHTLLRGAQEADPHPSFTQEGQQVYPAVQEPHASQPGTQGYAQLVRQHSDPHAIQAQGERYVERLAPLDAASTEEYAGSVRGVPLILHVEDAGGQLHTQTWTPAEMPTAQQALDHARDTFQARGTLRVYRAAEVDPDNRAPGVPTLLLTRPLPL